VNSRAASPTMLKQHAAASISVRRKYGTDRQTDGHQTESLMHPCFALDAARVITMDWS